MGTPKVELYINGTTWTDITSYVLTRDHANQINITTGKTDESSQFNPSTCTFQLNNADGRFTPRNPMGPYYGQIGRNTQLRVSVLDPSNSSWVVRFWGEVSAWPQDWDATGRDVWVDLEAAGPLRRLNQGQEALRSPIFLGETADDYQASNPSYAYWPCEDGSTATQCASGIGGPSMSIYGSPQMSSDTSVVSSDALPVMGNAKFTGTVPSYTVTGTTQVRWVTKIPTGTGANTTLMRVLTTGSGVYSAEVYYNTGGALGLRIFDQNGTSLGDSGLWSFNVDNSDIAIQFQLVQSGSNVNWWLYTYVISTQTEWVANGTFTGAGTVGRVRQIIAAPDRDNTNVVLGHITLQGISSSLFDLASNYTAWFAELAGDRFNRLVSGTGLNAVYGGTLASAAAMGAQTSGKVTDLIQQVVEADGGLMFEDWSSLGLGYTMLNGLYILLPQFSLDYTLGYLAQIPKPVDDDRYTRNDVTITRTSGSFSRKTLDSGTLSVQAPPFGVGPYTDSKTINIAYDSQVDDQANWRLHVGTVDEARYPAIVVDLSRPQFANNNSLVSSIINCRIARRIELRNCPIWMGANEVSQLVIGMSETIDQFQHIITFICAPESPYRVAFTNEVRFGFVGIDDTNPPMLAVPLTTTGTSLTLASPGIGWTADAADYPFDLNIGGERITAVGPGKVLNANPTFPTSTSGWSGSNSTISWQLWTRGYERNAIAVTPNGTSASGGLNSSLTGVGSVVPGQSYTAACWVFTSASWTDAMTAVDWYDSSGTFLSTSLGTSTATGTSWVALENTFTAPASASQASVRFRWGSTPPNTTIFTVVNPILVDVSTVSTTSPQTMTVVRSVNGVVKAQLPNTSLGGADGTFESGTAGWSSTSATLASTSSAHTGTKAGLLTVTGTPTLAYTRTGLMPVVSGTSYTASLWAEQASGSPTTGVTIDWFDSGSGYLSSTASATQVLSGSYTFLTVTGNAPANAAYAHVGPSISSSPPAGTAINFDDVAFGLTTSGSVDLYVPPIIPL